MEAFESGMVVVYTVQFDPPMRDGEPVTRWDSEKAERVPVTDDCPRFGALGIVAKYNPLTGRYLVAWKGYAACEVDGNEISALDDDHRVMLMKGGGEHDPRETMIAYYGSAPFGARKRLQDLPDPTPPPEPPGWTRF